jgi:hypothetical protein
MISPYYRPSGRASLTALPIAILGCAALLPAAFAYAWLTLRAPFVLNFFIAFGYSYLIGVVVKYVATLGKVRNARWMGRVGCGMALAAWYCQWAAWIAMSIASAKHPVATSIIDTFISTAMHPSTMLSFAIDISKTGTISIGSWQVTGGLLAAVWLMELGMHLLVAPQMGRMRAGDPFCEVSNTWAEVIVVPGRFAFVDAPAAVAQSLETDPRQILSVLMPCTEDAANYSEVVIYGAGGTESYVSITNVVVTASPKGESKKTAQAVLECLRVPDMDANELLRHLTALGPDQSGQVNSSERPTPPELAPALDHLEADRYQAALEAALPYVASPQSFLRTDAIRLCALASSRLGLWSEALVYWQRLTDDELTAHNALQSATSAVMAGDLPQGETWLKEATKLNATSGELPGLLILTNFVTALTQAGLSAAAMPYLEQIRQAYVDIGVTDPTVLYVNRMPAFGAFLDNSSPVIRAALDQERGRGWYAAMAPHLDDRGNAELSQWLDSHFDTAQC